MGAKSPDDMRDLKVLNTSAAEAPHSKNDLWGFNFIRMLSKAYISSGVNVRVEQDIFPSKIENYGFEAHVKYKFTCRWTTASLYS